jgi:hypothetical protein
MAEPPYDPGYPEPTPPVPVKKKKTGLIILIVVVVLALIGTGLFFAFRSVVGNRLTPYCVTYVRVGVEMDSFESNIEAAGEDLQAIGALFGQAATSFQELRDASPPQDAIAPLETVIEFLTVSQGYLESGDGQAFGEYYLSYGADFVSASNAIDSASVEYCQ